MNQFPQKRLERNRGFSLSQTSIALVVSGLLLSAVLPGGGNNDENAKIALTKQRMIAIEEATKKFMATNYRRPCPASGILATSHANFGAENGTAGSCSVANFTSPLITITGVTSSYAVAGIVPVRALGLPDEYALDGFGRRMMYIVDRPTTSSSSCRDMQSAGTKGIVRVRNASTDTVAKDRIMAALISYGKDGHGAFPSNGSTVANRVNTFTNDANTQANAFNTGVGATLTTAFSTGAVIKREASSTFDDIVYYDESMKDKCCIGPRCSQGFRLDGSAGALDVTAGINYVAGDFDYDGNKDLAISTYNEMRTAVTIVLSTASGWPSGITGSSFSGYMYAIINNDPRISYFGYSMAAGDVTGDGRDDLFVLGEGMGILVYNFDNIAGGGELAISSIIDEADYNTGINITHSGAGKPGAAAIADIDGDTFKDIIFGTQEIPDTSGINAGSEVGVVWGRDSRDFTKVIDIGSDADSFYMYSSGDLLTFPLAFNSLTHSIATGNINGDEYQDILFGGHTLLVTVGSISAIFGRPRDQWGSPHDIEDDVDGTSGLGFGVVDDSGGIYLGQSVALADMNKDGYDDMLYNSSTYILVTNGKNTAYAPPFTFASGGVNYAINLSPNKPAAATFTNNQSVLNAKDVNNDGLPDILLSNPTAYMSNAANAGMTYVLFNPTTAMGHATTGFSGIFEMFTVASNGYGNFNGTKGFLIEGAAGDYAANADVIDLNLDKKPDVVVAAPGYDHATTPDSALYVINGRTNTDWKSRSTPASSVAPIPFSFPKIDLTDWNQ